MRDEICAELKKVRSMHIFGEKVVNHWISCNFSLNDNESLELLRFLSQENYIFQWLELISHILPTIVYENEVVDVINNVFMKIKNDLAQGPFIRALILIGETHPERGVELHEIMLKKYPELYGYGGLILGGAARVNSDIRSKIEMEISSTSGNECVSYIRAIRVTYENIIVNENIFNMLKNLSKINNDNIKQEILLAYFDFYESDKTRTYNGIKEFTKSDNALLRYKVSDTYFRRDLDVEHYLELTMILSDDQNTHVLNNVATALALKCKQHTEFCLTIIKKWLDAGRYRDIKNIGWTINEIGGENLEKSLLITKDWLYIKNYIYHLYLGEIFWDLGKNNVELLIDTLLDWLDEKVIRRNILNIFKKIFSELQHRDSSDVLLSKCLDKLIKISISEGFNAEKLINRENELIYKCSTLMKNMIDGKPKIKYDVILSELNKYPNINKWIDDQWMNEQINSKEYEHPILLMLSNINEGYAQNDVLLNHIEDILSYVDPMEPNVSTIKNGLKNVDQFWQTISEVEVISKFRNKYIIEIEPSIEVIQNGKQLFKKPDLKATINSKIILIEVISPDMYAPLKYFGFAGIPNRLRSKIYTEFKDHFLGLKVPNDIIIIVDTSRSEIRYDSADEYLGGSYSLTMRLDKETRRVIDTFPSRSEDSMDKLDPDTRSIIGIILYRRIFGTDRTIHLAGKIFANEDVINEQGKRMLLEIKESFFG